MTGSPVPRLVDSHAHLDFDDYRGELPAVVERARAAGLVRIVLVGLWRSPGQFGNALELATARPGLLLGDGGDPPARVRPRAGGRLGRGRGARA